MSEANLIQLSSIEAKKEFADKSSRARRARRDADMHLMPHIPKRKTLDKAPPKMGEIIYPSLGRSPRKKINALQT